jgi:peptidoglycan/xylan/chitin deacetylase (PgdA/CDA1 family)
MAVLALMYHRTPAEAGHVLDVPMPLFRAQIQALQAAGIQFIRFGEALDRRWYDGETVVTITFDDGHESNLEAMAFLHEVGIPSTSFFVSDFVRLGKPGYMESELVKVASGFCEVGAHGASHTGFTSLAPEALEAELLASKAYLEALCGRAVMTLSAPGGAIDRQVVRVARKAGFEVVGDSEALLNTSPCLPLHRVCMLDGQGPEHALSLVHAGPLYWARKRLRRIAVRAATQWLGNERLEVLRRTVTAHASLVPGTV